MTPPDTGLVGMVLFQGGWVHGAAVGLLLVAASQAIVDHYSERRAMHRGMKR